MSSVNVYGRHSTVFLSVDMVSPINNVDGSKWHFRSSDGKVKGSAFLQSLFVIIRPHPNTRQVRV